MGIFPGPRANCASAERRDGGSVSRYVFKLPDLGEGTVQAEIVGWRVKAGDVVSEDDVIVEVMTDKAAVEVPAPVSGRVLSTTGAPGDMVPVGSELIVFETDVAAGETGSVAAGAAGGSPAAHGAGGAGGSGSSAAHAAGGGAGSGSSVAHAGGGGAGGGSSAAHGAAAGAGSHA